LTPDIAYTGARLLLSVGDTSGAVDWLERSLAASAAYDPTVLTDHARIAAFMRAMIMRAALAAARNDPNTVRRWMTPVRILWASADSELQATMNGMAARPALR
jgi:hypothetical protein